MTGCAAIGCRNRKGRFFRFPTGKRDHQRLEKWLHNVGRTNFPYHNAKLCEEHFTEESFENHRADGKRKLRPDAIPTLFFHRVQLFPTEQKAKLQKTPIVSSGNRLYSTFQKLE